MKRILVSSALAALGLLTSGCGAISGLTGLARVPSVRPPGLSTSLPGLGGAPPMRGAAPFAPGRAGRNFDESKVSEIQKGKSTRAEIEGWTGGAMSTAKLLDSSGRSLMTCNYVFVSVRSRGPWRASRSSTKALTVRFDERSVVVDYTYSENSQ